MKNILNGMTKNSVDKQRWHFDPWMLDSLEGEQLQDAFTLMCHDERYVRLREQRTELYNKVVELQEDPRTTPSRMRGAYNAIIEKDKEIAQIVLECLAVYSDTHDTNDLMTMDDLLASEMEDSPEKEALLIQLTTVYRRLGFKIDSIETDIVDIDSILRTLNTKMRFTAAAGVKTALQQLRSFIHDTNMKLEDDEEEMLYADTADSISAYIDKRVQTFMKRLADMRNKRNRKNKK